MTEQFSRLPIYTLVSQSPGRVQRFCELLLPLFSGSMLRVAVVHVIRAGKSGGTEQQWSAPACAISSAVTDNFAAVNYSMAAGDHIMHQLASLSCYFDLVFVDGPADGDLPQIVLEEGISAQAGAILVPDFVRSPEQALERICAHAAQLISRREVWACILIGGKSSRMGQPKHLIEDGAGSTWLERLVGRVEPLVSGVALSGRGAVPAALDRFPRLPDIPGVEGPLTGILSAMRWQPDVSWLLLACDMPSISIDAVAWLLSQQKLGHWASLPTVDGGRRVEPLFARYEPQCHALFEMLAARGERRIGRVADFLQVATVEVPLNLRESWKNVNTPEDLKLWKM